MPKKLLNWIRPLLKPLVIFTLVFALVFGHASGAMAASRMGGGRIGGGSFRAPAPSRTYTTPSRPYVAPGGGGYYPGGGFGFPFVVPIFAVGGGLGSLFTLLLFVSVAGFLIRTFRGATQGEDLGYSSPSVSIARLQVGLLAEARELQADLNRLAETADTGSAAGLAQVLQETTLSLSRHPEYWVYAGAENGQTRLELAEAQFNRLALGERSKFSAETLSNVNNQLRQAAAPQALPAGDGQALMQSPGEYIVVTLLVAAQGNLTLPEIRNTEELRRALNQVGSVSSDRLLALEVLWTPQVEGETLSAEDVVAEYPDLRLV